MKRIQLSHRHFFTANIFLITISIYLGVTLFYNIVAACITPLSVPRIPVSDKTIPPSENIITYPLSHYKTIVDRNLFRTKKNPKTADSPKVETLETTDLELKLWGTVIGGLDTAYAIIEETIGNRRNREQTLYETGDSVQGATIKKILDEKVVLTVEGKNQVLEMEDFVSSRRTGNYRTPYRHAPTSPLKQTRTLRRGQIDSAISNISELMTQARFFPHSEGIKISNIKAKSIFRRLGLINGDIITRVDGKAINSVDNALELYDKLKAESTISIQLNRRGRERIINYLIR